MAERGKGFRRQAAEEMAEAIEAGRAPWQMRCEGPPPLLPNDPATKAPYRGFNALWLEVHDRGDSRWMTAGEAAKLGGRVKAGEEPAVIESLSFTELAPVTDKTGVPFREADGKTPQLREVKLEKPRMILISVYNAGQIEGLDPEQAPVADAQAGEKAEKFLAGSGIPIRQGAADLAYYNRDGDEVVTPARGDYESEGAYFSDAFRAVARGTGSPERLPRRAGAHGTETHAREALRTDMATFLLSRELGIGFEREREPHVELKQAELLRKDPHELFRAARDAEIIKTWVMEPDARPQLARMAQDHRAGAEAAGKEGAEMAGSAETKEGPRRYLAVPYAERKAAKAAGALWDRAAQSWYAPEGAKMKKLAAWDKPREKVAEKPVASPQEQFAEACREHGLRIQGLPAMDGKWRRAPVEGDKGKNMSGSYRGYLDGRPSGTITNFKSADGTVRWVASKPVAVLEKRAELKKEVETKRAERKVERERSTEEAAKKAYGLWKNSNWARKAMSKYLRDKDVFSHGVKHDGKSGLRVPVRDVEGKLVSLQFIDRDGNKKFLPGGAAAGGMHKIDREKKIGAGPVIIAEGYATAASLHEATGHPAVCAFNAGNLKPVAEALREKYPKAEIVIAADDDRAKGHTAGLSKAMEAAHAVGGASALPPFTAEERSKGMTDYNDFARARGKEAVAEAIKPALDRARSFSAEKDGGAEMEM